MSFSSLHDMVILIEYFRQMPNFPIVKLWNSFKREKKKKNQIHYDDDHVPSWSFFFPQMPGETTFGKQDLGASVPWWLSH